MEMYEKSQTSFFGNAWFVNLIVVMLFVLGFGIRMVDLTDLPLDFHPSRQLLSATKARGMYYQFAEGVPSFAGEHFLGVYTKQRYSIIKGKPIFWFALFL